MYNLNRKNIKFVIPARKGSKGLLHKNRKLVPITVDNTRCKNFENLIISTDDEIISTYTVNNNIRLHSRSNLTASDCASMLSVLQEVANDLNFEDDDIIICLYPTYPTRTLNDIKNAFKLFTETQAKSLLCRTHVVTQPYLCMRSADNNKGKALFKHNLYRRQDYPQCFKISHFVIIIKVSELKNVNDQLLNEDTVYMWIDKEIDVDTHKDLQQYYIQK